MAQRINGRQVIATAIVLILFTAAVRFLLPKLPVLDRLAPYV